MLKKKKKKKIVIISLHTQGEITHFGIISSVVVLNIVLPILIFKVLYQN